MKRKNLIEINTIAEAMMQGLEKVEKKTGILRGDFVCHDGDTKMSDFDRDFIVCGEDPDVAYLVMIQKIDL
jgi:hypothetical protein